MISWINSQPFLGCSVLLLLNELELALLYWVQVVQLATFGTEMKACKAGETLHRKSSLLSLNSFLDDKGTLRVGGRLKLAKISFATKHPIILPSKSCLSSLVVSHKLT